MADEKPKKDDVFLGGVQGDKPTYSMGGDLLGNHKPSTEAHSVFAELPKADESLGAYAETSPHKFHADAEVSKHLKAAEDIASEHAVAKTRDPKFAPSDAQKKTLSEAGQRAHNSLDKVAGNLTEHGKKADELYKQRSAEIKEHITDKETAAKAQSHLDAEYKKVKEELAGRSKAVEEHRVKVKEWTAVESKGTSVAKLAEKAGVAAKEGESIGRWAQFKKNWAPAAEGGRGKLAMGAATVGAGVLVVDGFRRLGQGIGVFSPPQDDQGKDVPVGGGRIIMGIGEIAAGGALGALFLTKAGKGIAK